MSIELEIGKMNGGGAGVTFQMANFLNKTVTQGSIG